MSLGVRFKGFRVRGSRRFLVWGFTILAIWGLGKLLRNQGFRGFVGF